MTGNECAGYRKISKYTLLIICILYLFFLSSCYFIAPDLFTYIGYIIIISIIILIFAIFLCKCFFCQIENDKERTNKNKKRSKAIEKLSVVIFIYFILFFLYCFLLSWGLFTKIIVCIFIILAISFGTYIYFKYTKNPKSEKKVFLIDLSKDIFLCLNKSQYFYRWLCWKLKKSEIEEEKDWKKVENYVIITLAIGVSIWFLSPFYQDKFIFCKGLLALFAVYRIYEIVVYQTNVLLFDSLRKTEKNKLYYVKGYTRLIVILIINYITIIFCFAILYQIFQSHFDIYPIDCCINGIELSSVETHFGSLYYSVVSMSSLGHGDIIPLSSFGRVLSIIHTLIAVFMNLILIARFVSLLPIPWTKDETENEFKLRINKEEEKSKREIIWKK